MQPKVITSQLSKSKAASSFDYAQDERFETKRQQNSFIKNGKRGFALIEIIVAMLIIGIMIGIAIPRFFSAGNTSFQKFVSSLNLLVQEGVSGATSSGSTYKLLFNFKSNPPMVSLMQVEGNKKINQLEFPKNIVMQDLFINRKNEPGREEAWLFISPDGTAQETIMNVIDTKIQEKSPARGNYSLVLNPFNAQFKIYDTFQKPNA